MRNRIILMIVCILILSICPPISPWSNGEPWIEAGLPTRTDEFTMGMNVSDVAIASFWGENAYDTSGEFAGGAGDVNGDGYDDILIGTEMNDEGGTNAGQTYLIFGKASGWSTDTNLSLSDASFWGENAGDQSGFGVAGGGDVNGDGYDDIVIGAYVNDESITDAGQTYLIFGKASGWAMDTNLSSADASFWGENAYDFSGAFVSIAGDVNGDGFDDILIGAHYNDDGGIDAGQTYLILGKASGWKMDTKLSSVDASFWGEVRDDDSGFSVSGAGDVNGDGYDDILIGAQYNDDGGIDPGQTYLIFGKASGWAMDTSLSSSDASFWGEGRADYSGNCVSGAGDVNGDGYDDILIGAYNNRENGYRSGQTYLIFGKASGWSMDTNLSSVDASFWGKDRVEYCGRGLSSVGDVNCDGYGDIIIGAYGNHENGAGAGATYLIYGKPSGWAMDTNLSLSDASFLGEYAGDTVGRFKVPLVGDVNGDGSDDILIGAHYNDEGGLNAGQTYLITGMVNNEPLKVYDIKVADDSDNKITAADIDEKIYVEISGKDSNVTHIDKARVNITFSISKPKKVTILLTETGENTGIYKGTFIIPARAEYFEKMRFSAFVDQSKYQEVAVDYPYRPTAISTIGIFQDQGCTKECKFADKGDTVHFKVAGTDANRLRTDKSFINLTSDRNASFKRIFVLTETGDNTGVYIGSMVIPESMIYFENITATSVEDPSRSVTFMVQFPLKIWTNNGLTHVLEDQEYLAKFYNSGYNPVVEWKVTISKDPKNQYHSDWLNWDEENSTLWGTPKNDDIGNTTVEINATDGFGHYDNTSMNISVSNTPPEILNQDIVSIKQNEYYFVDYESDDEGFGDTIWMIKEPIPSWLEFDSVQGILNGTPRQGDVGFYTINVSVDDGNGESNWTEFELEVIDVNEPPQILTVPITTIKQDSYYSVFFNAIDPDWAYIFNWGLTTDASWLSINGTSGEVFGTPTNDDIGIFFVNVSVFDRGNLTDFINYTLEVIDINDAPTWTSIPMDFEIDEGEIFEFDVEAVDIDKGAEIGYRIESIPDVGIDFDGKTGLIRWEASLEGLQPNPFYLVQVTVYASDSELEISHWFTIKVIPNPSPITTLISPVDEELVPTTGTTLRWGFEDDSTDILFDIHFCDTYSGLSSPGPGTLFKEDLNVTFLFVDELLPGKAYFWTAIPKDRFSIGTCSNPIWKFMVNTLPRIDSISSQTAAIGKEWKMQLGGSDNETLKKSLEFSMISGPEGMEILEATDYLVWTPGADQIGDHTVMISLFDGLEYSNGSFTITVKGFEELPEEPDDDGFGLILIIVIVIIILVIVIGLTVFFILRKKKGSKEEETTPPSKEISIAAETLKEQAPLEVVSTEETVQPPSPEEKVIEETPIEGQGISAPMQNKEVEDMVEYPSEERSDYDQTTILEPGSRN